MKLDLIFSLGGNEVALRSPEEAAEIAKGVNDFPPVVALYVEANSGVVYALTPEGAAERDPRWRA